MVKCKDCLYWSTSVEFDNCEFDNCEGAGADPEDEACSCFVAKEEEHG